MGLETGTYLNDLVVTNPPATDPKAQGDDHLRLIKSTAKATFPGFVGVVIGTGAETGSANAYAIDLSPAPAAYSALANTVLVFKATHANTGAATLDVNSLGTKPVVNVDGTALASGDIPDGGLMAVFYDGTSFLLFSGNDRAYRHGDTYTGSHDFTAATVTAPTQSAADNSTNVATTAYADAADDLKADLDGATYTGAHDFTGATTTVATAAAETNDETAASTAFVQQQAFQAALPVQTGEAGKVLRTDGTNAAWSAVQTQRVQNTSATLLNSDINNAVLATGSSSPTWTLPEAADVGAGTIRLINDGDGDVTLARSGSDTIDGLSGYVMYPREVRDMYSDGVDAWTSVVVRPFVRQFTSSGSFTEPPGYTSLLLDGVGGGGGACSGNAVGGGGGGGRYQHPSDPTPGASVTVTIGAGGSGAASGSNASAGGATSYGSTFVFYGGGGGVYGTGGGGGGGSAGAGSGTTGGGPSGLSSGGAAGATGTADGGSAEWGGASGASGETKNGGGSLYGGGGGASSGSTSTGGGVGGRSGYTTAGGGAAAGSAGTDGDLRVGLAGGGGGGGNSALAPGNGGAPGGGGGAGGSPFTGGSGGRGELVIWGIA